ncbi:leucine-rich repeat domain-containing protein [Synechococcus sp. PCC 7336]|uniref:leucine-rich repeat domain-containing protein n=1 Tax=Synechococcus sp. PCC 7336 TaxID=195250 RepID=UPI0003603261|nr:leucine-rich repeat domain-containing protein [Synechococcus sp. PCC 7336]
MNTKNIAIQSIAFFTIVSIPIARAAASERDWIFPDPQLEAGIRMFLRLQTEQSPGANSIEQITQLDISRTRPQSGSIASLEGIQKLSKLQELLVTDNQVRDLAPLAHLTELSDLHLEGNQIADISPLANLNELIYLHLEDNQIEDLSPLSSLDNLVELHLSNNRVVDVSPLINLRNLKELDLSGNPLDNCQPLPPATREITIGCPD